jgi:hypothetical protein
MDRLADRQIFKPEHTPRLPERSLALFRAIIRFPFDVLATIVKRTAQVLFAIVVGVLHPGFKWLLRLVTRSPLVRDHIGPAVQAISRRYFEPYFAFLRRLPPYWATVSIAVPVAALEPAKLYATILTAEHPRAGLPLLLFVHGLSFVLIEKTWSAVRPQSRKIWLVSRLHAWGWLNVSYGKHWIKTSLVYKIMIRWRDRIRAAIRGFRTRYFAQRRTPGI